MQYLHHQKIDKEKWDASIIASRGGNVYALSWYLNIVAPGWDAVVSMNSNSHYELVMPVPRYRKFGIPYVRTPHFANQLGVVSLKSISSTELLDALTCVKSKYDYILDYPLNLENEALCARLWEDDAIAKPFIRTRHTSYEIDLTPAATRAQNRIPCPALPIAVAGCAS